MLNTEVFKTKDVPGKIECVMECVTEPCCRSVNYRKTLKNSSNCEMLHNVLCVKSEKELESNSSYDYVYLTNPKKV